MTRRPAAFALVVLSAVTGSALLLPAQDVQDRVERIFDRIEESRGLGMWEGIRELDQLGPSALPEIRKGLTRADAFVRVAVCKVLYTNEFRDEALGALAKVVEGKNAPAKKAAADMIASLVAADKTLGDRDRGRIRADLEKQAEQSDDALAQIALHRAVWSLTGNIQPARKVREILASTGRKDVKEEAALTLAEMDKFVWAKATLAELAKEPSDRGRMARSYLKVNELTEHINRQLANQAAGTKYDFRLLEEAIDALKSWYYDEGKVVPEKLVEAATRGAVASLDPYTVYMDEAAIEQLKKEDLGGEYGGIGARVSMQKDKSGRSFLTIVEPIFSGPAYRAGLRSGDTIIEVEGESTMNKELSDLVRRLRGKAGTKVSFKVIRRGWTKEREFSIARERIQLETTTHRMLPGDIGYIKLSTFGEQDIELVEKSVTDMKGMKALVFDLRGNSGGYLRTAHKLASYFLNRGQLIVSTKGRGVEQDRRVADGSKLTDVPMVVLVDDMSASASEILAGALQDHKRAVVVGRKTFGKGSVQDMKYLKTTEEKSAVKVTISKWYLPSGRTVEKDKQEEGGVHPDVKAEPPEREFWKEAEFERLLSGDEIDKYVKELLSSQKDLAGQLAESDGGDPARYPKFDALYEALKTKASKEEIRELVRDQLRRGVQDERARPFYFDFQKDHVLQRGILEACKLAKVDPKSIKDYEIFAKAGEPKASTDR